MWSSGVGDVPPTVVPYLVFPWVVASDRLQALGWTPSHTNEETILETVDARPASRIPSVRTIVVAAGVAAAGIATGLALVRPVAAGAGPAPADPNHLLASRHHLCGCTSDANAKFGRVRWRG